MSNYTVIVIVAAALVLLAIVALYATSRRKDRDTAYGQVSQPARVRGSGQGTVVTPAPVSGRDYERSVALARSGTEVEPVAAKAPALYVPPDEETLGVTRRQFLNRSIVGFMAFGLQGFGLAVIAFLWPSASGGFGAEINVGSAQDVRNRIRANNGFLYVPEGRAWLTEYPTDAVSKASAIYPSALLPILQAGFTALWQTCPHLGCRVPECKTSQWFECPCHGSQYNRNGEKKGGPAPRGMDRFPGSLDAKGNLLINTGQIIQGPPIGTNTTGQEAEGPHCIGSVGGGH